MTQTCDVSADGFNVLEDGQPLLRANEYLGSLLLTITVAEPRRVFALMLHEAPAVISWMRNPEGTLVYVRPSEQRLELSRPGRRLEVMIQDSVFSIGASRWRARIEPQVAAEMADWFDSRRSMRF